MLASFQAKNPGRSLGGLLFYEFCYFCVRFTLTLFYKFRVWNSHLCPISGPVLVVTNHQSHLDPIVAGMAIPSRHLNFVAKSTLFKSKLFGALIQGLNSIPLKQGESDTAAIRTTIEYLKQGRCMLIFPEGSRTLDGAVHEFKRGAWLLMSRAKCTILPIGIDGCFDAFPRSTPFPRLWQGVRIGAVVGQPISAETLLKMSPDEGLAFLRQTVEDLRLEAVDRLRRTGFEPSTIPMNESFLDDEGRPLAKASLQG